MGRSFAVDGGTIKGSAWGSLRSLTLFDFSAKNHALNIRNME
jgi:hypothetical protein